MQSFFNKIYYFTLRKILKTVTVKAEVSELSHPENEFFHMHSKPNQAKIESRDRG